MDKVTTAPEDDKGWQENHQCAAIVHKQKADWDARKTLACASRPLFHGLIQCRYNEPIGQRSINQQKQLPQRKL